MQCILDVVNPEFDTKLNLCMYIWMQDTSIQKSDGPHPKHHRELDISYRLVSPLWCKKIGGTLSQAFIPRRRFMDVGTRIKSRMQRVFDVVNFEFDTETCVCTIGCRLLQSNKLTGLIPDNIGNLTNLQNL